jgi:hypothetical protein
MVPNGRGYYYARKKNTDCQNTDEDPIFRGNLHG